MNQPSGAFATGVLLCPALSALAGHNSGDTGDTTEIGRIRPAICSRAASPLTRWASGRSVLDQFEIRIGQKERGGDAEGERGQEGGQGGRRSGDHGQRGDRSSPRGTAPLFSKATRQGAVRRKRINGPGVWGHPGRRPFEGWDPRLGGVDARGAESRRHLCQNGTKGTPYPLIVARARARCAGASSPKTEGPPPKERPLALSRKWAVTGVNPVTSDVSRSAPEGARSHAGRLSASLA
jgi:hypothetical protein